MLLKLGSIFFILLVTGYSIIHFHRSKQKMKTPIHWTAPVLVGVFNGTMGFLFMQTLGDWVTFAITLSIIYAIITGILVGGALNKVHGLNQILTGFIGAALGSVLGYITFITTTSFFVIDIVFILFIYLLLTILDKTVAKQTGRKISVKQIKKTAYTSSAMLVSGLIVLLAIILLNVKHLHVGMIGQPQKAAVVLDEGNDLQVGTIHVTPSGLDPKTTTLKAKTMLKAIIKVDLKKGEQTRLISNDLHLDVPLKNGENIILLDNPIKGKYQFVISPGNYKGEFIVE